MSSRQAAELAHEIDEAAAKAWESLARYKFWMFGYWAAIWVHLNRISGSKRPNPWKSLVEAARAHLAAQEGSAPAPEPAAPLLAELEDA